jgi:hypothetical protein
VTIRAAWRRLRPWLVAAAILMLMMLFVPVVAHFY